DLQAFLKYPPRALLADEEEAVDAEAKRHVDVQTTENAVGRARDGRLAECQLKIDDQASGVLDGPTHQVEATDAEGAIDLDRTDQPLPLVVQVALRFGRADVVR